MGTCTAKEQKQDNELKHLNKIINELLNARKNVFRYLNVSYKMEKKLEKIDAKTDMQLIQRQMEHYDGQYDYQSFMNSFDLLTQTIQLSKNILQNISKSYSQVKNEKFQNQINFLNQYLSTFVLETCEDYDTEEGGAVLDQQVNNMHSLEHIQEYEKDVFNIESLKKLPQDLRGQQSLNQIKGNSNQLSPKQFFNSKSLSDPNTAYNFKEEQTLSTSRKTNDQIKTTSRQPHLNSYPEFIEYKKNNNNPNFQKHHQNKKSFTVLIIDGQIKIQQSQQKIDLDISDSLVY